MHTIKSFKDLNPMEKKKLYSFYEQNKGPVFSQSEDSVFAYMGMRDLDDGGRFLSVWSGDIPLATLGSVVAALSRKHEVYLIGASAANTPESRTAFESLIDHANRSIYEDQAQWFKSRLGIGPRLSFLIPPIEQMGYRLNESMLTLFLSSEKLLTLHSSSILPHIPLIRQPLNKENMPDYIRIHNASFQRVPNGSETSSKELCHWLECDHKTQWRGLLTDPVGKAVAFYELSQDTGTGWIDSIGVDPALHGHGYGSAALYACLDFLISRGCSEIDLNVMDSNTRAYGLYTKNGFALKNIFNRWYQMEI